MSYGLTDDEFALLDRLALQPLISAGAKVYIFGSRARGQHRKFSDVDLLVESTNDLTRLIAAITEALEESNFPLKVDLVPSQDLASSYRESVWRDRKPLG